MVQGFSPLPQLPICIVLAYVIILRPGHSFVLFTSSPKACELSEFWHRMSNWRWEDQLVSYCNTGFKKRWRQSRWRVKNSGEIFWSWWQNLVTGGLHIFTFPKIFLEASGFISLMYLSHTCLEKSLRHCVFVSFFFFLKEQIGRNNGENQSWMVRRGPGEAPYKQ